MGVAGRFMQKLANIIDQINEWVGRIAGWSLFLMVIITFLVVVFRYGIENLYSIAFQESAMYFHALAFMVGIAYTFKHQEHVRVDIFYQNFSPQKKAWVDLFGTLFLLIPFCVFILWISTDYVLSSWQDMEGSKETGGLPLLFILKSFIPLFTLLLLLQGISESIKSLLVLASKQESDHGIA
jgi:TRAP-type mannitol/chloroaromatic compound transport system permease small subunit